MAVSRTETVRLSARAMATPAAAGRATGTGRMRKSGRLRLGPASAYSRRSTAAARKPLMDDSAQKPFMPADAFGRSLSGFGVNRSEEHTSELQSLMRISYAVFCLKKKKEP